MYSYKGLILRLVEKKDLEKLRKLRNDESTWINLNTHGFISYESQISWFNNLKNQKNNSYFIIETKKGEMVGSANIREIEKINKSCGVGANVLKNKRGKGYGSKIYDILINYIFNFLNMNRIWLQVLDSNKQAINLYKKKGFKIEGILNEAVFRNGKYMDLISMRLLKSEFDKTKKKIKRFCKSEFHVDLIQKNMLNSS